MVEENEANMADKRRAPRFKAEGALKLIFEDGLEPAGLLKDVSRIGAFVTVAEAQEEWVFRKPRFELTVSVAEETLRIEGECVVIRATRKGVGIYITDISTAARLNFVKFMSSVQKPENAI